MSIFMCEKCGCVENTACCNYWESKYPYEGGSSKALLCSECDPDIGRWHGRFEKRPAKGMVLGSDGFLYSKEEVDDRKLKRMNLLAVREIE